MTGTWYTGVGTREALFSPRRKTLLFGSFRGYANFGDLLQLHGALRWHRERGDPDPLVVCDAASIADADFARRLKAQLNDGRSGGAPLLFWSETRLDLRAAGLEELRETPQVPLLHVYGGGFLNGMWGRASLRCIESIHERFGVERYVLSGQQVGPELCDELTRHFARCRPFLAGGRDPRSVELLRRCGADAVASFDDGSEALSALAARMAGSGAPRGGLALHLNRSAYTGDGATSGRLAVLPAQLARLREWLTPGAPITLLHAYRDARPEIADSLAVVRALGEGFPFAEYRVIDLVAAAADPWGERGVAAPERPEAELALSSSYHVALLCGTLGIPCFLEADNAFYRQKRDGLGLRATALDAFLERPERACLDAALEQRAAWLARLGQAVDATGLPPRARIRRDDPPGEPPHAWAPPARHAGEVDALRAWLAEREQTIAWLRTQVDNWRRIADERGAELEVRGSWIAEQERARRWLDDQRQSWAAVAGEREETIRAQRRWIRALEDGKRWLERRLAERAR